MFSRTSLALVGVLHTLAFATPSLAQDNQLGADAYQAACAVCHGSTAQGDGEFADVLTVKPSDLTMLASKNDGVFPYLDVFRTVDGRTTVRAHGSTTMPIWGDTFKREVGETSGPYGAEILVRARIVALVDYLESLQK